jgi:plastocyanin
MSTREQSGEPLVGEVRFRVPLPIVIPVVGLAVIAAVAIGISQVLLALPHQAATAIAVGVAANVMGVFAYVALRRKVGGASLFELGAILLYPIVIGIAVAALNIGEHAEAPAAPPAGGGGGGLSITAENIAFDTAELVVPAAEEFELAFDNPDSVEHNVSVYPDQAAGVEKADALFTGEIINGGESTTYSMGPFDAGEYFFQCDVHPNMNGALVAE